MEQRKLLLAKTHFDEDKATDSIGTTSKGQAPTEILPNNLVGKRETKEDSLSSDHFISVSEGFSSSFNDSSGNISLYLS